MPENVDNSGNSLRFECSHCGFNGQKSPDKPSSWFSVSQHIKMAEACRNAGAKVLTISLDKDGNDIVSGTSEPGERPEQPVRELSQPTMADEFASRPLIPPIRNNEMVEEEDDETDEDDIDIDSEYNPSVKRVSIGRTAVPELPAWVVATYEAFCASGYQYSLSRFIEEAIALDLIFTGVNVQILPYSAKEREAMLARIGAIAEEVA